MKMKKIVQRLADMEIYGEMECELILASMPKTLEEYALYSKIVTTTLLEKAKEAGMDLETVLIWLHRVCEDQQYRAMHLYLIMCYQGLGLTPPPFFLELALQDSLLTEVMQMMLQDAAEYVLGCADNKEAAYERAL